jgi:hypothetical protein
MPVTRHYSSIKDRKIDLTLAIDLLQSLSKSPIILHRLHKGITRNTPKTSLEKVKQVFYRPLRPRANYKSRSIRCQLSSVQQPKITYINISPSSVAIGNKSYIEFEDLISFWANSLSS